VRCCYDMHVIKHILLLHSEQVQSFGNTPDCITAVLTALCSVAVREQKTEEDEEVVEEEEHVEMTVWDTVTNYFQANEEVT